MAYKNKTFWCKELLHNHVICIWRILYGKLCLSNRYILVTFFKKLIITVGQHKKFHCDNDKSCTIKQENKYYENKNSVKFSLIFPSFVYSLATKPKVKGSRASGQSSEGVGVENRAEIWLFFSFKFFKIVQFFSHFCSCVFLSIRANLEFIPINFIGFKVPSAQFWSSGCEGVT